MKKILHIFKQCRPFISWVKRHKYLSVTIVFVLIIFVVDDKNVIMHFKNQHKISELENEIAVMKRDSSEIVKLQSQLDYRGDINAIEDLARDKYGMTKENEEVFIIKEK